jgi:dihydroneopterin aldolase
MINMGKIKINNIKLYANHGCLAEEGKIGSMYQVDIVAHANFKKAAMTDNLIFAVDYVSLNNIVREEMAIRSLLLESVAKRIIDRMLSEIPLIKKISVKIAKINPPISGNVENVCIIMSKKNKKSKL